MLESPSPTGGERNGEKLARPHPEDPIAAEREIRDREAREYDEINSNLWWQDGVFDEISFLSLIHI